MSFYNFLYLAVPARFTVGRAFRRSALTALQPLPSVVRYANSLSSVAAERRGYNRSPGFSSFILFPFVDDFAFPCAVVENHPSVR